MAKPLAEGKKCPQRHFQVPLELFGKLHFKTVLRILQHFTEKCTINRAVMTFYIIVIKTLTGLNWLYSVFLKG